MGAHVARDAGEACKDCGAAPEPGRRRCAEHAAAHNAREAERRAKRKKSKRCVVCGSPAERARTLCATHSEYYRRRARVG